MADTMPEWVYKIPKAKKTVVEAVQDKDFKKHPFKVKEKTLKSIVDEEIAKLRRMF